MPSVCLRAGHPVNVVTSVWGGGDTERSGRLPAFQEFTVVLRGMHVSRGTIVLVEDT